MQEPSRAFLSLEGDKGSADPQATRSGEPGWLEVHAWNLAADGPRDAASGLPTGKRQAGPLVIAKPVDDSSSRLMRALVDQEVLPLLTLEVWRPTSAEERHQPGAGDLIDKPFDEAVEIYGERLQRSRLTEKRAYRIELRDARVASLETEMRDGVELEQVTFSGEGVRWTWDQDGEQVTHEIGVAGLPASDGDRHPSVGAPARDVGAETVPPTLLGKVRGSYPTMARKLKKGPRTVRLRLLIGADGKVERGIERLGPKAGAGFDQAAEKAARASKWKPGTIAGTRAAMPVELAVKFVP